MSVPQVKSRPLASRSEGAWLTPLSGPWIEAARHYLSRHATLVRVTVTALRGSAPREPGASLLVHSLGTVGTIGGGRLEWHAISLARQLLLDSRPPPVRTADLVLGPQLGQCCGGRVELWLERLTRRDLPWLNDAVRRMREAPGAPAVWVLESDGVARRLLRRPVAGTEGVAVRHDPGERATLHEVLRQPRPPLWIFGAGHVGQALVRLLAELALFEITWIDSRPELLPPGLPEGVAAEAATDPAGKVAAAPAGTRFVVLTHDHGLDYELCRRILARADSSWLGLIGSASKSARFRSRLLRDGLDRQTLSRLTCPIGVPHVSSKLPAAIAIAIAAQLLQQIGAGEAAQTNAQQAVGSDETDSPGCTADCRSCTAERPKRI